MKLSQRILRLFGRKTEHQRREFRMALACATAHAEDLTRTTCFLVNKLHCIDERREKKVNKT
jgi:hypothetical protein